MNLRKLIPSRARAATLAAVSAIAFSTAPANAWKVTIEVPLVDVDISIEVCVVANGEMYCSVTPA